MAKKKAAKAKKKKAAGGRKSRELLVLEAAAADLHWIRSALEGEIQEKREDKQEGFNDPAMLGIDGFDCPYCDSHGTVVTSGFVLRGVRQLQREIRCENCGKSTYQIYELLGWLEA